MRRQRGIFLQKITQKEKRLIARREYEKRRKVTETPEEKEKRLIARREYEKK